MYRKTALGLVVGAILSLSPGIALAEYVCSVSYIPGSTVGGEDGYVYFQAAETPLCPESKEYVLCSQGATDERCSSRAWAVYDSMELQWIASELRDALDAWQPISIDVQDCIGGGDGCATSVSFGES